MRQAAAATEFVAVPVDVSEDPTAVPVHIAIVDLYAPIPDRTSEDWLEAEWDQDEANPYSARLLVGPDNGALELTAGSRYTVAIKIGDNPEEPIRKAGILYAY
jgi:hypothetical protein